MGTPSVGVQVQFLTRDVENGIVAPVRVVEMPPFVIVDGEAFGLHGAAKKIATPALEGSAAGIVGVGARRHFVVGAGHFDRLAGFQIVEGEVDGATAIVAGTLRGIGNEDFSFGRRGVPENFGDIPGTVGVVDEQTVAERFELVEDGKESFGGRTLKKGTGLRIDGNAEEVVGCGIANVEVNGGIERGEFDQVRVAEGSFFRGRGGGEGFAAEVGDGAGGSDMVGVRGIAACVGAAVAEIQIAEASGVPRSVTADRVADDALPLGGWKGNIAEDRKLATNTLFVEPQQLLALFE